ncbi:Glycosyltransferase involved in cell wall bisynthesis [Clostridium cavendishii DSM 21758]|uniref:Glycosyltransferase involved in cell wall bisynthesis n=1 Tax=Clostridium cavendishii DSM 21758 TaxID=1121302 RepID=A0A1M6QBW3_9CLOT|nr:glycosyltransferase family 2 protein [Clostridium cavendishii]SHK17567.1 Glycosyltransferase involved in cell wall bisynthesis [Clostridium cavendishii DSM 21758]
MKRISIITVTYNCERSIEKTINSILNQTYSNIEFLIIDGLSKDNTLNIVNRYKDKIAKVISEKDHGIYDAMNKGLKNATGEIIYFLNSDDSLVNKDVINNVMEVFNQNESINFIYGDAIVDGKKIKYKHNLRKIDLVRRTICHQAVFIDKSLINRFDGFDTKYRFCADYKLIMQCLFYEKCIHRYIEKEIVFYNLGGISAQNNYEYIINEEKNNIYRELNFHKIKLIKYFLFFRNSNIKIREFIRKKFNLYDIK